MQVTLTHTVAAEIDIDGRGMKAAVAICIKGPERDDPRADVLAAGDQAVAYAIHVAILAALEQALQQWPLSAGSHEGRFQA
jgi:hypothetical protein